MVEKFLKTLRILLKLVVTIITLFIFIVAIAYWINRMLPASFPLLIVSALSYFCVIKDHSEDFWMNKFDDDPLVQNLCMMIIYIVTLLVILFGIVIAAHLN